MAASQQSVADMKATHVNHFQPNSAQSFSQAVQYRTTIQDSLDGNTVDEQIEQAQFMQNSIQYQASLDFLGGKFNEMIKALRGE